MLIPNYSDRPFAKNILKELDKIESTDLINDSQLNFDVIL